MFRECIEGIRQVNIVYSRNNKSARPTYVFALQVKAQLFTLLSCVATLTNFNCKQRKLTKIQNKYI